MCNSGCPGTSSIGQVSLKLRSLCLCLGWQTCLPCPGIKGIQPSHCLLDILKWNEETPGLQLWMQLPQWKEKLATWYVHCMIPADTLLTFQLLSPPYVFTRACPRRKVSITCSQNKERFSSKDRIFVREWKSPSVLNCCFQQKRILLK